MVFSFFAFLLSLCSPPYASDWRMERTSMSATPSLFLPCHLSFHENGFKVCVVWACVRALARFRLYHRTHNTPATGAYVGAHLRQVCHGKG